MRVQFTFTKEEAEKIKKLEGDNALSEFAADLKGEMGALAMMLDELPDGSVAIWAEGDMEEAFPTSRRN